MTDTYSAGKSALFDWLTETLDEAQDKLTVTLHIDGNAIDAVVTVLQKEVDGAGRIVTAKREWVTPLRIKRKGKVLNLAR